MRFSKLIRGGATAALSACLPLAILATAATSARAEDDAPPAAAAPKDTVRPEVGKPLLDAQALIKNKQFKDAYAKIKEAEAAPNRTPYENFMIDSTRASTAAQAGDDEIAVTSFEGLVNSGRLQPGQQSKIIQALAGTYFTKLKNYPKAAGWAARYLKEGGTDPSVQDILFASYFFNKDYKACAAEIHPVIDADLKAGRIPSESRLQMMYNSDVNINAKDATATDLELLLTYYPQKTYWDIAISHAAHRSGAERLELDLLRLQNALGDLRKEGDVMELAQLAMEAGFPTEGKKVLEQGFASGALGKGAEAERQKRLLVKATKDSADDVKALDAGDADAERSKTGEGMVNTGYNYVINGKADHGLPLIEAGLKKGGLRHPEEGKLHLGIAYYYAGDKSRAIQTLRSVTGTDGTADIAHLWAIYIGGKK